jgi:hypothetical protein
MKDIFKYIEEKNIEAEIIGRYLDDCDLIGFNIYDCRVSIKLTKGITLEDFLNEANKQYFKHIKNQRDFYVKMSEGLSKKIDNYTPVLR